MSQWAGGVLTAAGRALQAKVEAGTTALVLTKIKLGDGTESMDAVDNLTDLVGAKAVLGISSSVADGDHATITGVVLSTQLQAGFWAREWGLFATDPDEGEILYMITIDAQPEWLPASTAAAQVSATYAMNIAVANATNIEVQIDPAGLVDVEMLDSYMGLAKRSTACVLGDTAMLENLPAMYFLECTTAGTTGATAPVITPPVAEGDTITDGSAVWTVRKGASKHDLLSFLPLTGGGALTGQALTWNGDDLGESAIVAKSMGSINGYVKNASGELRQWGITGGVNVGDTRVVTFPVSFYSITTFGLSIGPANGTDSDAYTISDVTKDGFSVTAKKYIPYGIKWLAIGK
ncbi:phage tail protein [uncultured Anaerovibrio sp.]|uniref:phage tail-collar fiber domain-containing protein n=1 Tax=uncultured Anaerovibrio sp. TaxID=361586 RepID=UPI002619E80E|nr:phage tail protein [uncultured Anaerovibrio sp.]